MRAEQMWLFYFLFLTAVSARGIPRHFPRPIPRFIPRYPVHKPPRLQPPIAPYLNGGRSKAAEVTISASCDPERTYCVLTCNGNIKGTEPVTYWWTADDDDEMWTSTKELKITKEDKEEWFSCRVETPSGSSSSEEFFNPLMKSDQTWIAILIPVVAVILFVSFAYLMYRCGKGAKIQWLYKKKNNGRSEWHNLREMIDPPNECSVTIDDIHRWFHETLPHIRFFKVNDDEYELNFTVMTLTNLRTKTKYQVTYMFGSCSTPPSCCSCH